MSRIRTIHPGFTRSLSMSRVSRDSRLLFILLWTVADDAGRLLADPGKLVPLLFGHDHDAPMFMTAWLDELEREGCIERYAVDGVDHIRVVKWATYQTIDHPTASLLPPSPHERPEGSRIRERSRRKRPGRLERPELQGSAPASRNGAAETIDAAVPELSEKGVLDDLHRVQKQSEELGLMATALRSIDLKGRHLGLWGGRSAPKEDDEERSRGPAEILLGLPPRKRSR